MTQKKKKEMTASDIEYEPIMDYRNKSTLVVKPN